MSRPLRPPEVVLVDLGACGIVLGGLVAAVTGPLELEQGSWAAAYLVLVVGVAQVVVGLAPAFFAARPTTPLLGWTTIDDRTYYVRQFRNMKGTVPLDAMTAKSMPDYAGIVGALLAKGHARTSGASMIAGYVGKGESVDDALCTFARLYADQTEADHCLLVKAARNGDLPIEDGALDRLGSTFRPK